MKRGISTSDPEIRHEGKVKKEVGEKIGKFLKRGGYIKDGLAAPPPAPTRGGTLNPLTINALEAGRRSRR